MLPLLIHGTTSNTSLSPARNSQNCFTSLLKAIMFDFSTRRYSQKQPPRFFVKTQGFEKRFFAQHFRKYFGEDVMWLEGTDMKTGDEGFEIQSPLQYDMKAVLVTRMKQDAQKEYQKFIDRRLHHRNTLGMVDRSPHIAASSCPHLDLFPSLERLDQTSEQISARLYGPPIRHRHSHSTPTSPLMEYFTPTAFPPPSHYSQNEPWYHPSFYAPSSGQCEPHEVPELRISHAPNQHAPVGRRPSLRPARSADNLDNIGGGRLFSAPSDYLPYHPSEY